MKKLIQELWMPVAGAGTSLSFKGMSQNPDVFDNTTEIIHSTITHEPLIHYFWIGILGALGGLLVKILYNCARRWIPFIKKIDPVKTSTK